jgi:hypothetical protein
LSANRSNEPFYQTKGSAAIFFYSPYLHAKHMLGWVFGGWVLVDGCLGALGFLGSVLVLSAAVLGSSGFCVFG